MKKTVCLLWMFFVLGMILSAGVAWSQGKIVGYVKDKHSGEPLIGANVIIEIANISI